MRLPSILLGAVVACSFAQMSSAQELQATPIQATPKRVKIGSAHVDINGCHEVTRGFTTDIPNPDLLDQNYKGILNGIEVNETEANGAEHDYRNSSFTNGGKAVRYELHAKGPGSWVDPVCVEVLGNKVCTGGGGCINGAGGSEGIEIYAYYK
jgi:hypothetical protein